MGFVKRLNLPKSENTQNSQLNNKKEKDEIRQNTDMKNKKGKMRDGFEELKSLAEI